MVLLLFLQIELGTDETFVCTMSKCGACFLELDPAPSDVGEEPWGLSLFRVLTCFLRVLGFP